MDKVIYAAYGSNLLKERFLVYIKGGEFEGKNYKGCKDKTDPVNLGWMYVPTGWDDDRINHYLVKFIK